MYFLFFSSKNFEKNFASANQTPPQTKPNRFIPNQTLSSSLFFRFPNFN